MKNLLTLLAIVLSANLYAQDSIKQNCNYRTQEVDEFTGTSKLVLESDNFIAFTDSSLMKYYKRKKHSYVECDIYCAKINDMKVAYLSWRLDTKSAYKYFGAIYTDSKFILKFTDGTTLTLVFSKNDSGDTNYDYDFTTYSSYIILSDEQIKDLSTKEIDKVRMYWSKGYESYPVINSKLFIEQIKCIK